MTSMNDDSARQRQESPLQDHAHDRIDGGSADTVQQLDFDDDDYGHPRGNTTRRGGTDEATGADSAPLGAPTEQLSSSNQPRAHDERRQ